MPYVTTDDSTLLYYKEWGRGRPVVLLHGWPLSADSWDDQSFALANAGYRVIAYDRRGFGRSSQPWNGYDYDRLTDDLRAVLKHCQVTEGALVGFSMGGGEVARYMSKYNGAGITQAGLIASIVPYKLKTDDNPHGTELKALEETTAAILKDRPGFFAEFFKKFYGVDTAETSRERRTAAVVIERDHAGRPQTHAGLYRVDSSRRISGPTSRHSKCRRSSFMARPIRMCRSMRQRVPRRKASRTRSSSSTKVRRTACWPPTNNA